METDLEKFKALIYSLMDQGRYEEAKKLLFTELERLKKENSKDYFFIAEVAGFFIDIGAENMDAQCAETGTFLLEENYGVFKNIMTEESYFYNLGNGKEALYKVRKYGPGLPSPGKIKPELIEAKNCLYRAFKKIENSNIHLALKIETNLAGNLGQAGRVVDAIKHYQTILSIRPDFPQALIGLAENLDYWSLIASYPGTQALYSVIYRLYRSGLDKTGLPPLYKDSIISVFQKYKNLLQELGLNENKLEDEFREAQMEYEAHSPYIKFCLDHHLMLNEHALYCKCNKSAIDNLSIGREGVMFSGDKVLRLELLLNRLKAEFVFTRKLYYESLHEDRKSVV